jgi:F-type H+-transporting ATPase subunit a
MAHFSIFNKEILSPLDQFEIRDLLSLDMPILDNLHLSITNIGFSLIISIIFILIMSILGTNFNRLVGNK